MTFRLMAKACLISLCICSTAFAQQTSGSGGLSIGAGDKRYLKLIQTPAQTVTGRPILKDGATFYSSTGGNRGAIYGLDTGLSGPAGLRLYSTGTLSMLAGDMVSHWPATIIPQEWDNQLDIGTTEYRWMNLYLGTRAIIDQIYITGNTVTSNTGTVDFVSMNTVTYGDQTADTLYATNGDASEFYSDLYCYASVSSNTVSGNVVTGGTVYSLISTGNTVTGSHAWFDTIKFPTNAVNRNYTFLTNTNSVTGTSVEDAFRVIWSNTGIGLGANNDALIFEKVDGNDTDPDGAIQFVMTGSDNVSEVAFNILGNGNIDAKNNDYTTTGQITGNLVTCNSITSNVAQFTNQTTLGYASNWAKFSSNGRLTFNGTGGIELPHGCFSDGTTQTITSNTTAYPISFNTTEFSDGLTHSTTATSGRIYINTGGTYLITFSAIGQSTSAGKHMDIWLAVNGVNVPRTNTITEFAAANNERIVTVTFLYTFTDGQYFELMWCSDSTGTILKSTGTQLNPTRPSCPAIICTVNMICKN